MLLQNEKVPNMKFAIGKEVISTDEAGKIEVEDKEVIEALLSSGFIAVKAVKKAKEKAEEIKVEAKVEAPEAPAAEDEKKFKPRTFKRGEQ